MAPPADFHFAMRRTANIAAIYIALAAMMLRALMPAGWMPASVGTAGVPLVICTMQGPVQLTLDEHGKPQKPQDGTHQSEACPFAAAPHVATPTLSVAIATPSFQIATAPHFVRVLAAITAHRHTPQSPRAPPFLA